MPKLSIDGCRTLVHTIIARAVEEALGEDQQEAQEALAWLRGPNCSSLCLALGLLGTPAELLDPARAREVYRVERRRCTGTTERGDPCRNWALPGSDFCACHAWQR